MAKPNSRESIIDYGFRKLGAPVIEINVDYEQAEDRLDEALEFFTERHFDGVERAFFAHEVTDEDKDNKFIDTNALGPINGPTGDAPTGKDIVSVVKVFQFGQFSNISMFDIRYQLALSDYFGINRGLNAAVSQGLASYDSTKRYINLIEDLFQPEKALRFSKVTNRLHLDMRMSEIKTGEFIIIEAYVALNPTIFTEIFNDRLLKKYFTALLKRQWGANLSKYDGVPMPGGVLLRGGQIYNEALAEVERIEQEVYSQYELPTDFMTG
tara:strand:+ start:885 stop:1688 length:804 start_codon:yes stop_codon:yes gene_type:complete